MRHFAALLLALSFGALPAFAGSEIYKYADANGSVRFTTNLDEVPPAQRAGAQASAAARAKKPEPAAPPASASDTGGTTPSANPSDPAHGRVRSSSHRPDTLKTLRNRLFRGTASSHGIDSKLPVWGVVMEEGLGRGNYYTLVALADGTGSIYFSNGGGVIGGKGVPAINAAARRMVEQAAQDIQPCPNADMQCLRERRPYDKAQVFNPPVSENNVRFWVLTPKGVLTTLGMKNGLASRSNAGWKLFYAGHEVMTGLREASERQGLK